MTRRTILFPLVLAIACASWVVSMERNDRIFLPRHPAARDLPYAMGPSAEAAKHEPFNRSMTDPVNLLVPDHLFAAKNRHGFSLPSWNPFTLGGVPQPQNPLTASYDPLNPARWPIDPLTSWGINAALRIMILSLGAWWHARRTGCDLVSAAFVGITTAFSGWSAAHWFNVQVLATAAWIPWALAGATDIVEGRRRVGIPIMAVAIGLMWVSGFPQVAALGTLACGVWALALWSSTAGNQRRVSDFGWLFLALILGLLLAAPQLTTVIQFRDEVARAGMTEQSRQSQQYPAGALVSAFLPEFLGGPKDKPIDEVPDAESDRTHIARQMFARASIGSEGNGKVPRTAGVSERMFAPGGAVLGLCLLALTFLRDRRVRAALIVAMFGLVVAILPLPDVVAVPLGLNIGAPARAIVITAMMLPLAAGLALTLANTGRHPSLRYMIGGFVLALGATLVCISFLSDRALADVLTDAVRGPRAARLLGLSVLPAHETWRDAMTPLVLGFRHDLRSLGLGVLLGAATWFLCSRPRIGLVTCCVVVGIATFDLLPRFSRWNEPIRRLGGYDDSPATLALGRAAIAADAAFIRISETSADALAEKDALFPPNTPTIHGLPDVQGYREQVSSRWLSAFRSTSAFVADVGFAGVGLDQADSPVLDAFGVRYLVASHALESTEGFESSRLRRTSIESPRAFDLVIYENPDARRRVEVLRSPELLPHQGDTAQSIAALVDGWKSGRIAASNLLLHSTDMALSSLPPGRRPSADMARTVIRTPWKHVVQTALTEPGWLVVRESFAPGFTAHVVSEGGLSSEATVVRAMGLFRAVALPQGTHEVTFRYVSPGETFGYALALVAMLLLVAWSFVGRDVVVTS